MVLVVQRVACSTKQRLVWFSTNGCPSPGLVRGLSSSFNRDTAKDGGKALAIGGTAGLLGSLVGLGGGFIAIPALTGLLRLNQHQAHGTSLGAVLATGAAGSAAYALTGEVDYEAAAAMAVAGMAGAHVGSRATATMKPRTLKMALGLLMIMVVPLLPLRDWLQAESDPVENLKEFSGHSERDGCDDHHEESSGIVSEKQQGGGERCEGMDGAPGVIEVSPLATVLTSESSLELTLKHITRMGTIGLGSGLLAGMFGIGGGVVTVPAITFATDLGHKEVLGTSLAAMVLPALVGSVTHFKQGNLRPTVALPLAVGTSLGAFLGGNFAARHVDEVALKWAFSAAMLVLGVRTFSTAARSAPSSTSSQALLRKNLKGVGSKP